MPEQENKERIIRLEEQMKAVKASLDDLTREVRRGFQEMKSINAGYDSRYATREEMDDLKETLKALTTKLWGLAALVLGAVIYAVLGGIGIK